MKQRSFLLTLLFLAVLATSCDPVAIDHELPDGSTRLCINSYFKADSTVNVYITRSKHILNNDLPNGVHESVNNAVVTISGGDKPPTQLPLGTYVYWGLDGLHIGEKDGWYESSSGFSAEETIQIAVSAEGMESLSAVCFIPKPVPLLKAEIVSMEPDEELQIPVDIYFNDPPETKNFYRVAMRLIWAPEPGMPPIKYVKYEEVKVFTDDPRFSFDPEPFSLNGEKISRPVLFSDEGLNGKSIKIRCKINSIEFFQGKYDLQVELQSISREQYLHTTTEALQEATVDDPFAQPVQVYSNVKNGLGIFVGSSCSVFIIDL